MAILLLQIHQGQLYCHAWIPMSSLSTTTTRQSPSKLFASAPPKQKRGSISVATDKKGDDEEMPANIGGAEFFGGNKEKEQFYDEAAEETAGIEIVDADEDKKPEATSDATPTVATLETTEENNSENLGMTAAVEDSPAETNPNFDRFADRSAFATDDVAKVARQMQLLINQVLYDDAETPDTRTLSYSSSCQWDSPLKSDGTSNTTPLQALEQSLQHYRRVDVAVVAGRLASAKTVELDWEISLLWPTFWEPRVLILGSSLMELAEDSTIVRQIDKVFGTESNLGDKVVDQMIPRFWDLYHIGMTPSAELSPTFVVKKERGFRVVDLPGRWVVNPTMMDEENDVADVSTPKSSANLLPFHAFNCVIKTVGPTKQQYVPTAPLEIQIMPTTASVPMLKWQVPMSVEFQSQLSWPNPNPSTAETTAGSLEENTAYTWQPPRRIAVVYFSGEGPQDSQRIPEARKRLYESVAQKSQWKIKFQDDRPVFTFWKNAFKGCYTEQGLGMAVYEWRPSGSSLAGNQIGMELELERTGETQRY